MNKRTAFWIGGIAVVATLGGVAAYAAFTPDLLGSTGLTAASTDPVRRTSRIDGDMRATFERLEKSGERPATSGLPEKAPLPEAAAAVPPAPIVAIPSAAGPVVLARPAKGMPVSLLPGQPRATSGEAPRVMDPRMTRALDLLAGSAPRATVAALPEAPAAAEQPVALRPPAGVAAIADKNESDMTAEELNAREHRRIRQAIEGQGLERRAGGTN